MIPFDRVRGNDLLQRHVNNQKDIPSVYNSSNINPYIVQSVEAICQYVDQLYAIELGANSGKLGQFLLDRSLITRYHGVEKSPGQSSSLSSPVFRCDCDTFLNLFPDNLIKTTNLFIYGDVLEHLIDPWRHLHSLFHKCSPGAFVVISVPCFFHHTSLSGLGSFRFDYEEWGVMDLTHLRHFSLDNILELGSIAGFQQFQSVPIRYAMDPHGEELYHHYASVLPAILEFDKLSIKVESLRELIQICSYQFIVTLQKSYT